MPDLPPVIRKRPHAFRDPEQWFVEQDQLVCRKPDGSRHNLPVSTLGEIAIWRSVQSHFRGFSLGGHVEARLRFGQTWCAFSGGYPRGIHGIEDQSDAILRTVHRLVEIHRENPDLRIVLGSTLEAKMGRFLFWFILVLPGLILMPVWVWNAMERSLSSDGALNFLWFCLIAWPVTSIIALALTWSEMGKRRAAGKLEIVTPEEYLAQPRFVS